MYVLLLEVSAKGPELHLEVSTLKGPELHLDVSALQRYSICLIHRDQCNEYIVTVERVRFALEIIFLLSNVFALLRK